MNQVKVFLVKPHPPKKILKQKTPVPEKYKYDWEPISLKILSYFVKKSLGESVDVELFHLTDENEDLHFLNEVKLRRPDIVAFTEIDILVNQVNYLAKKIKKHNPAIITLVGGKQTSLLRAGDKFPFRYMDFAIGGDGITPFISLVQARIRGSVPEAEEGFLKWNSRVTRDSTGSPRVDISNIDGRKLRSTPVNFHPMEQYISHFQKHPAILRTPGESVRTAPLFTGSGCAYKCYFCQSPLEFGKESHRVLLRPPGEIANEIVWLYETYKVNNFFSLEPNLCPGHLVKVYRELRKKNIPYLPTSGFIRAADVVKAAEEGFLTDLARSGLRFLSIGLDIPPGTTEDIYGKGFSHEELARCLEICEREGILLLATFVGNPDISKEEFKKQLESLENLAVADIDIRLAMALRNTEYFQQIEKQLIYHPDRCKKYFDRQNYRYQTIRVPGKIKPRETYKLVKAFKKNFLSKAGHRRYIARVVKNYADTKSFFKNQYETVFGSTAVWREGKNIDL